MKKATVLLVLFSIAVYAESFKYLLHCKATCVSYIKNCDYNNNVSIYLKYTKGKYNNTICHKYKGGKEYCTKIIEGFEEVDDDGKNITFARGETVSYGVGNHSLILIYEDHSVGHYECVREYEVK